MKLLPVKNGKAEKVKKNLISRFLVFASHIPFHRNGCEVKDDVKKEVKDEEWPFDSFNNIHNLLQNMLPSFSEEW